MGAEPYETLALLGAAHEVILTVLPNADIVRQAVLGKGGLITGMRPGTVLIEMTTSLPAVTQDIAAALSRQDVMMIDAPVSGGVQKAENGTLTIMVGGNEQTVELVKPILENQFPLA